MGRWYLSNGRCPGTYKILLVFVILFWDEGVWRYVTVEETPAGISVRSQHGERIKLDRLEASELRLTLGVETAPDGNSEEEYKKLLAA
jgi:hypothetical protein